MGISDFYEQKTSFVNSFFVDMNKIFEKFFFKFVWFGCIPIAQFTSKEIQASASSLADCKKLVAKTGLKTFNS